MSIMTKDLELGPFSMAQAYGRLERLRSLGINPEIRQQGWMRLAEPAYWLTLKGEDARRFREASLVPGFRVESGPFGCQVSPVDPLKGIEV